MEAIINKITDNINRIIPNAKYVWRGRELLIEYCDEYYLRFDIQKDYVEFRILGLEYILMYDALHSHNDLLDIVDALFLGEFKRYDYIDKKSVIIYMEIIFNTENLLKYNRKVCVSIWKRKYADKVLRESVKLIV